MKFQGIVPILLILAVICISTASGRKSARERKSSTTSTTETSLEHGDNKEIHEGLSAELLGLKEQARNGTGVESSTRRPREKKQKHRRKNKHHRGPHRQKKNRTRPTDILKADDDKVPNQQVQASNPEAFTDSRDNEKLPIPRNHRRGKNKHGRNRGTRHLDLSTGEVHRRFTNGHHGGNHNHKDSEISAKEHRRRRNHHKKHNKPFTPSLEMKNTHEPK